MHSALVVSVVLAVVVIQSTAVDQQLYEYHLSLERNRLENGEKNLANYTVSLDNDEEIVNAYMNYLKWEEFQRTRGRFLPAQPIQRVLKNITQSKVFDVLRKLPKGGNMHLHHNHVVSKEIMMDLIIGSDDYDHLYVKTEEPYKWAIDFFINPPNGYAKVKGNSSYTREKLLQRFSFLQTMDSEAKQNPTDTELRWKEMGPLFGRLGSGAFSNAKLVPKYMEALMTAAMKENVQYLETRASAGNRLYVLDPDPRYEATNGKRYIDTDDGDIEIEMIRDHVLNFTRRHPTFIGYRRIVSTSRTRDKSYVLQYIDRTVRLHQRFPDIVVGFDLVAEEDRGNSLLFYMDEFITQYEENGKRIPNYFHTAETNFPRDLMTSRNPDDPVSTMENAYDSIILGTRRIGHGLGYIKHPYLMGELKRRGIAIEANPVSNQMLGYVPDLRSHPALTYFRYGIPVVLGSDDPGTFGYDNFTVDWYMVFMAWGLDLLDLKQLAVNSLKYSAMNNADKKLAIQQKWRPLWAEFIADMKSEACTERRFRSAVPTFTKIFPREGYNITSTVQVYGRHFESAICERIICEFGDLRRNGTYVRNNLILCEASVLVPQIRPRVVPFSISLDSGRHFYHTSLHFSFLENGRFAAVPTDPSGIIIGK
ncbi:hypothetical protein ScPMuIL_010649 [Solemya velum]